MRSSSAGSQLTDWSSLRASHLAASCSKSVTWDLADYSMKQICDEYMDDLYNLIKVRNVIYYLAREIGDYPREEDIRIIYFMC